MDQKFYQACYGRTDSGWSVINTSPSLPKALLDDFAVIERGNAAMAAGTPVSGGDGGALSCMTELYCRNDVLGFVRVQYRLSDIEGRPISFAHGYLFPDAYEQLKDPNKILRIQKRNYSDQTILQGEQMELRSRPGALNRELIRRSEEIPDTLSLDSPYTLSTALERCGMDEQTYRIWIKTVYAQILTANAQKNLYVKTDGSLEYALNLLYLTYIALPYPLRPVLSASTCLYKEQRNTKLIFCSVSPDELPWIEPATGENNVLTSLVEERVEKRNPIVSDSVGYVLAGVQKKHFDDMEEWMKDTGDVKLNSMQAVNMAHSMVLREFLRPERLPVLLYQWLSLSVPNTADWEKTASDVLLFCARKLRVKLNETTHNLLVTRSENAVTTSFSDAVRQYLDSVSGDGC